MSLSKCLCRPAARGKAHAVRGARGGACIALSIAACASAADLPKQGSFSVTSAIVGTAPAAFEIADGKWAAIFDARIVRFNDAGSGFMDHSSGHCIGLDAAGALTGSCVYTDRDGDKIFESFSRSAGASPKGSGTFTGGTGKYKGITGTVEFQELPPLAETSPRERNLISKGKGTYRIP